MDTNWNLQGKIFEKDGVISAHVIDVPYPAVHTRSQLTAVYYGNDVNLWFQQENGDIHTLHYTDGLWYAEDEAVVTDAKTGSSLSAVTWDSGDGSRAKKDQLIRLFYIITDGSFAQIQHSDAHGWSTNSPSTKASSVPTLSLQLNNPLAAFLGVSTGLVDPEIWIVTTATISDSVYKAVLFGSPAASGFKSVDNKSTQMYTEVFKTSFLRSPGDPLSVALLAGDINNDQSTWMWFGIGLNNRLYNTWWDGSKFDAAQVKIYETIPDA